MSNQETLDLLERRATQAKNLLIRRIMLDHSTFRPTPDIADAILGSFDDFLSRFSNLELEVDEIRLTKDPLHQAAQRLMEWIHEAQKPIEIYVLYRDGRASDAVMARLTQ